MPGDVESVIAQEGSPPWPTRLADRARVARTAALTSRARSALVTLLLVACALWTAGAQPFALPNGADSVKFAVIGDSGTGDPPQFQLADEMAKRHAAFPFDRVIMLGDNIYGRQTARDLDNKFAKPYKALLDAGVKFYASLGNHDSPNNRNYPLFNMGGAMYYTYATKNVRFFALDSNQVDAKELAWLENALKSATEDWKICYFHHPLYSNGGRHGSSVDVRVAFEPLFVTYGVNVVFSGHDHIYERLTPQKGIQYFVSGAGGQLREANTRPSATTAKAFDRDLSFMLVEVNGDQMWFQTISRAGQTVDSGIVRRQAKPGTGGGGAS